MVGYCIWFQPVTTCQIGESFWDTILQIYIVEINQPFEINLGKTK